MKDKWSFDQNEQKLIRAIRDFVPEEIFDIHVHPYDAVHFGPEAWTFLQQEKQLGCKEHQEILKRYMPSHTIHGLYFGMPHRSANRPEMNRWVASEVKQHATSLSRALQVVAPPDDPQWAAAQIRSGNFCGFKVYHIYASRADTMNASITEYAPEWMWEILNETSGVLMLHIVRNSAMDDADNQREIRRLSRTYPRAKIILAHVARSFSYRHARQGLRFLEDLDNVVVDSSAVCESESFRAALKILGPKRILWGSDFAVSELRGRCVTTATDFFWLHPEVIQPSHKPPTETHMTLVGIESLCALKEACEDTGLTSSDIRDIFAGNALRLLTPHLPEQVPFQQNPGREQWLHARTLISGGTGLLSKRAELYDEKWPSYFSRASGCNVWDMAGNRFMDFAGGIGAVLLGYGDPDVTAAIERRLMLGTYCSLVNPQEIELAEKLLQLHPWAGKVRFARGGGEAMTIAVRIARAATGKSVIVFCGYHGWQDWYLAANLGQGNALDGHLLPGLPPKGVPRELQGTAIPFRYNDLNSFQAALDQAGDNLAAVVMEPMRSQEPLDGFLDKVASACRRAGAVLVVDEITSGLRYGFPGALSRFGIQPDIAVYAKAMSNGIPFATVIGRQEVMAAADDSFISSSYWTDGIGPAAALATLHKIERLNVQKVVWDLGLRLQTSLKTLAERYPDCRLQVGGLPATPTIAFQLGELSGVAKALYIRRMLEKGFLVSSIYYLMHAHDESHVELLLAALDIVLADMQVIIREGTLASLVVEGSGQGFTRLA